MDVWDKSRMPHTKVDMADAITRSMDGSDYGRGQVEAAAATAENCAEAIGVIVAALAEKGVLTASEVNRLLGYRYIAA